MTTSVPHACAALLLTGGASRRFGSPKAELVVDGVRLAERVAAVLTEVADPVVEVGPGYTSLAAVQESPAGGGPLVAIAAGCEALANRDAPRSPVLVVAVDLPFVDVALLTHLRDHPSPVAVVPRRDGRAQPLCARYPDGVGRVARMLVDRGERAVHALLASLAVTWVEEPEWTAVAPRRALYDVDTPDDARRIGIDTPG